MTVTSPRGYLNKKEIEASYGRSYRSLTRDITRAVRAGDTTILQYLKLVTEDGKLREGTDVTLDLIQELSNSGLRPMWLAEETWVADWCAKVSRGRRDQEVKSPRTTTDHQQSPSPTATTIGDHSTASNLLQQRIKDLKQQNEMLRGQLQIKDDQIRTANQLAEQSQQLMRDLHILLKNVQDGLLGEGNRTLQAPRTAKPKSIETAPEQTSADAPRPARGKTKSAAPKRTVKSRKATKAAAPKSAGRLQRWLPTLLGPKRRRT